MKELIKETHTTMTTCKLCNNAVANKTNSHILPHFLIKTAINKDGSKQRDYELTFSFSENEFVDTYFGRSITLDTIEEYKGRELNEDELKKENPFSIDYLFCGDCEDKISQLEDYYSKNIYQKLLANSVIKRKKDSKKNDIIIFDKIYVEVIFLFAYSIFFRSSISSYHGFNLKNLERKLRKVLNKFLGQNIEETIKNIEDKKAEFQYFPIINTFFKMPDGEDPTKNFVTILHSDKPFFVYLNQITFQMFVEKKHVGKSKQPFFGINDMIAPKEAVNSDGKSF
ncbi:MAG TPA: hypothetical protein PKC72_14295 [Chitinophagaceae bacterium]|nr:hypothetical protein [Chitinophagaceae bacterium]